MKTRMAVLPPVARSFSSFILALGLGALNGGASNPVTDRGPGQPGVFVFVQRTDRHVKYSKGPEVFHNALNDVLDYLKEKHVAIAVDEFGGRNHAESATPMETVFKIARDANATSVLYVVVDRPLTKWIKITVTCYDMSGEQLWHEEASSGGGFSGGHGFEVTTRKLHGLLDARVGKEGLPVLAGAELSEHSQ